MCLSGVCVCVRGGWVGGYVCGGGLCVCEGCVCEKSRYIYCMT